jgi:photosystem II oxygen-evolving enhancer protein 2
LFIIIIFIIIIIICRRLRAGSREIISFLVFEILSVCRRRAFDDATMRHSFRSPVLLLEKEHPPRVFNSFFLTSSSSSSSSPKTDSPKRVFSNQVQSIKRTRKSSIKCSSASSSSTTTSEEDNTDFSRRQAVLSTAAGAFALTQNVNPSYALSGFNVVKETRDGYQFIYPVGWQEISVDGQAKVFKDIIEPLESISLNIYPTERESLKDIGTAQEVAETLVKQALSAPGALGKLLSAKERTDKDGHLYYSFEFVSKTKSYERHALTTVTITQGKFFTLTTGSSERRWDKMKERLNAANDSFQVYY